MPRVCRLVHLDMHFRLSLSLVLYAASNCRVQTGPLFVHHVCVCIHRRNCRFISVLLLEKAKTALFCFSVLLCSTSCSSYFVASIRAVLAHSPVNLCLRRGYQQFHPLSFRYGVISNVHHLFE